MIVNFVIGVIIDLACAGVGVLTLVRARRCARGRFVAGAAGVALVLHALISVLWRAWLQFVYFPGALADPGAPDMMAVQEILVPVRTIAGTLILTVAIALFIGALVAQARDDRARPQTHGPAPAPHGPAYAYPAPPHPHQGPSTPHAGADPRRAPTAWEHPPAPGQWSPPRDPGQAPQAGAPGTPAPGEGAS